MKVYFGKELREPICEALKLIRMYLDDAFDIKQTTLSNYESKVEADSFREHTIYAITDLSPAQYHWETVISKSLCGGYLGSTELKCGILGQDKFFEKEGE